MNKTTITHRLAPREKLNRAVSLALFSCLLADVLQAQSSYTWNGASPTSGNWSDSLNWSGGAPTSPQGFLNFTNITLLPLTTRLISTNDFASASVGYQIYFKSGANAFNLYGNSIAFYDFGGGNPNIQNEGAFTNQTVNFPILVGNTANSGILNINVNTGTAQGPLTFNGTVSAADANLATRPVNVSGTNSVTFNGVISDFSSSGKIALTQLGNGTTTLTASNTFTGDTSINAGTMVLATNSALANGANFIRLGDTIGSTGANLNLNGGNNLSTPINVRSGSSGGKNIANTSGSAGNATFAGNIFLDADATLFANSTGGNTLSGTTLDLKNQTLTIDGTGSNVISGPLTNSTGSGKLVKINTGTLTVSGTNSYTGGTTISGGTLIASSTAALGAVGAAITASGGSTLDLQTDGSDNAYAFNLGSGATATIASDVKTGSVGINHTLGATAIGNATLTVVKGTNVSSGSPSLTLGALNMSAGAAGTSILNPTTASLSLASVSIGSGSNLKTLQLDGTSIGNTITGIIANGLNTVSVSKANTSTWTLGGANSYTGGTTVTLGTLNVTGSYSAAGSLTINPASGNTATMNVSGTAMTFATGGLPNVGTVAGGAGILNISAGTFGGGNQDIRSGNGGFGVINVTGGTVTPGAFFVAGLSAAGTGIWNISGGTVQTAGNNGGTIGGNVPGAIGQVNITGTGSYVSTDATASGLSGIYVGENSTATLNVSGAGSMSLGGASTSVGLTIGKNSVATAIGAVNLGAIGTGGGTITAVRVQKPGALALGTLNFHGGTLKASTAASSTFLTGLTAAYDYSEGAVIDDNGQTITIGQAILAPTGSGVTAIANNASGFVTTGYSTAPLITFSGGTVTDASQAAAAVATIDGSGNLTAITIRNPGVYSSVAGLTATLSGGGKNTTTATTVITTAANTSGGLTKQGAGTTTLSSASSTYSGGTTIKAGTLSVSTSDGVAGAAAQLGVVPSSATPGNIVINGGTLNFSAAATLSGNRGIALGPTSGSGSGTISAATGISVINSIIADNGGTGALIKTGAGTLRLQTVSSTYSGDTTVSVGTLDLNIANALPFGAGKGNLILSPSTTLLVRFGENINGLSGSGTIDSPASTTKGLTVGNNDVTSQFDGVIQNGTGAIAPTKVGTGTLTLTGASTYSGATTIQNGAVQISGANDRLPTGASVTLGSATPTSGKLILGDVTSARNQTIATLTTTGAGTANAVVGGNPSISTLTITNTSSYGGFLGGAGANENNLALTVPSGTLTLSGNNTYIGNTTINTGGTIIIGSSVLTPFGTGTLTLSGGTLTTSASRTASSAPVTNAINLTADSAITTSSTAGTVDLNLTSSSISGSAGTLIISNAAASGTGVFQPRFSAGFTFSRPIVIANGSFGTTLLQSFNTSGNDQIFNGIISGSGSYKRTATAGGTGGNTIFTAANTYTGGTSLNDGALGFGIDSTGSPVTSGPIGTGTLTVGANNNVKVFAAGSAHTVGNAITFSSSPLIISGTNNLTLSGAIDLGASTRTIQVDNTAASAMIGAIGSSGGGLIKTGTGTLTFAGTNTYTGTTTVNAGALLVSGVLGANLLTVATNSTLAGTGTINGATTVQLGGTLQAGLGSNDTSTLTISNSLTLAGNAGFNLNRTNAQTASKVAGLSSVNYGGALTVTNVGGSLTNGDTFVLFTAAAYAGGFTSIILPALDPSLVWNTNNLAINGSISVALAISPSSLALTSSANPSGYLGAVNFTATVTPINAAGSVTFYNGATPFSTNTITAGVTTSGNISTLARGTNTITASYGGTVNFYGSTNALAQVVTNHAPTATLTGYYRGPTPTWRIKLVDLVISATDVDSDALTITAFGTSTNGITLTTNSGFALYYNTNLVNDQFTYTVADGFGGTATGTVNLTSQAFISGQNGTVTVVGSTATVSFAGIPGFNYTAQRSTNLVSWASLLTTNAPSSGLFQVIDDFSDLGVVPGSAYYRLVYNP